MQYKVWHIPQVPGPAFEVRVASVKEGMRVLRVLANYDRFQYEHHIKPDYAKASGLAMREGPGAAWEAWYDAKTDEYDIWQRIRRGREDVPHD